MVCNDLYSVYLDMYSLLDYSYLGGSWKVAIYKEEISEKRRRISIR